MVDLSKLTKRDFDRCLNQVFLCNMEDHNIPLLLTDCKSKLNGSLEDTSAVQREPFSLLFRTNEQPQLEQGTYSVTNDSFGELYLFLVPVGIGTYESIFS